MEKETDRKPGTAANTKKDRAGSYGANGANGKNAGRPNGSRTNDRKGAPRHAGSNFGERNGNGNGYRPDGKSGGEHREGRPYEKAPREREREKQYPRRDETDAREFADDGIGLNETENGIHGEMENGAVIGRNAVRELLKSGRPIDKLLVRRGDREGSIVVLVAEAVNRGIPVVEVDKNKLDQIAGFAPHQGVVALAAEKEYCEVEDILKIAEERGEAPLIVIADGITDPYNLGALIRCAEGSGAHGLIIPKRRASGLTPLVTKASAGAIEHLAIAKVVNLTATVQTLQKAGVWVFAAEAGGTNYYDTDFTGPCALVFGSEGNGVSDILKQKCDGITSIPMYGQVNSLNVSTAAAVILSEAARQHRDPRK